jgi:Flp pilus assembly protein TadG
MTDRSSNLAANPLGKLRSYARSSRGSVLAWAAFLTVPLLGFIGLGADSARGYLVRARLSQSLDAAALAAGRQTVDAGQAEQAAKMVFKANFPSGYMDTSLTGPTITFNSTAETVTASASAVLPTYFVHLLGIDNFTVSASSEVTRKTVYMDVVMSVDVSGSMNEYVGGTKKIDAARTAAQTLVDSLFGSAATKDLLKMGLVTWSANARILDIGATYSPSQTTSQTISGFKNPYTGATQTKLFFAYNSPVPLLSSPPSGWTGCARARFAIPDDGAANDADLEISPLTVNGKNWLAWDPAVNTIQLTGGTKTKPTNAAMQCNTQGTQRLTNTKATIGSAVSKLTNPTGNTNLVMGLVWAWTVLAPKGAGSPFDADSTAQPASGQGDLIRAIVLMTDGDNTQSATDAYEGTFTPSGLDARTLAAAQKIKDAGVIIYTIRFGAASKSEGLLKQVASGTGAPYYQYAPDAAALKAAFQEIGHHLMKLRISK